MVYGVSRGGYMGLRLAAADRRVCGVVGMAPCTDWSHLHEFQAAVVHQNPPPPPRGTKEMIQPLSNAPCTPSLWVHSP